jgi:predicted PurR-regulated permease PerM
MRDQNGTICSFSVPPKTPLQHQNQNHNRITTTKTTINTTTKTTTNNTTTTPTTQTTINTTTTTIFYLFCSVIILFFFILKVDVGSTDHLNYLPIHKTLHTVLKYNPFSEANHSIKQSTEQPNQKNHLNLAKSFQGFHCK